MTYIFLISAGIIIGALFMGLMAMKALDGKDRLIKRLGIENQALRSEKND